MAGISRGDITVVDYENWPLKGKNISKEEALKVLADAEEEGLVHCTYNVQEGQRFGRDEA